MRFPSMGEMPYVRNNLFMRILRGVQLLFAIVILGVSAGNISNWHAIGCDSPSRIDYNIAAAVLSLIALIYLIASTGVKRISVLPWHAFIQLGLDVFFVILWIAAAATSTVSCDDACHSCKAIGRSEDVGCGFFVDYGDSFCTCYFSNDNGCNDYYYANRDKRAILDARKVFGKRASRPASTFKGVKIGGKLGVNIIMLILFVASTAGTAYLIWRQRKMSSTGAPSAEAGAAPSTEPKTEPAQPTPMYGQQTVPTEQQQQHQAPSAAPPMQQQSHPQEYGAPGAVPSETQQHSGVPPSYHEAPTTQHGN